jgi:hypothetical protein
VRPSSVNGPVVNEYVEASGGPGWRAHVTATSLGHVFCVRKCAPRSIGSEQLPRLSTTTQPSTRGSHPTPPTPCRAHTGPAPAPNTSTSTSISTSTDNLLHLIPVAIKSTTPPIHSLPYVGQRSQQTSSGLTKQHSSATQPHRAHKHRPTASGLRRRPPSSLRAPPVHLREAFVAAPGSTARPPSVPSLQLVSTSMGSAGW